MSRDKRQKPADGADPGSPQTPDQQGEPQAGKTGPTVRLGNPEDGPLAKTSASLRRLVLRQRLPRRRRPALRPLRLRRQLRRRRLCHQLRPRQRNQLLLVIRPVRCPQVLPLLPQARLRRQHPLRPRHRPNPSSPSKMGASSLARICICAKGGIPRCSRQERQSTLNCREELRARVPILGSGIPAAAFN